MIIVSYFITINIFIPILALTMKRNFNIYHSLYSYYYPNNSNNSNNSNNNNDILITNESNDMNQLNEKNEEINFDTNHSLKLTNENDSV